MEKRLMDFLKKYYTGDYDIAVLRHDSETLTLQDLVELCDKSAQGRVLIENATAVFDGTVTPRDIAHRLPDNVVAEIVRHKFELFDTQDLYEIAYSLLDKKETAVYRTLTKMIDERDRDNGSKYYSFCEQKANDICLRSIAQAIRAIEMGSNGAIYKALEKFDATVAKIKNPVSIYRSAEQQITQFVQNCHSMTWDQDWMLLILTKRLAESANTKSPECREIGQAIQQIKGNSTPPPSSGDDDGNGLHI